MKVRDEGVGERLELGDEALPLGTARARVASARHGLRDATQLGEFVAVEPGALHGGEGALERLGALLGGTLRWRR